jgi:hypothetical protein
MNRIQTQGPGGDVKLSKSFQLDLISSHVLVFQGNTAVLEQSSLLGALAERCGQAGAMNWLSHFLQVSSFKGKEPYVVLFLRREVTASSLTLEDVHAAVMLFEYRVWGLPTGAFCADDWAGFRTVIAPEAQRGAIAAMAVDALLKHGAQIALISYHHALRATSKLVPLSSERLRWGWLTLPMAMSLPLETTFEATLATLGKSTRNNLKYYRRRLAKELPCEFVADARDLLNDQDLEAVNRGSLNPIALKDFRLQYRSSCTLQGGFLMGLRNGEGKWLSLVGGWRQAGTTVHYWQMNTAGYEKLSIGKAMLSYFLEHEVNIGTRTLSYNGGTPNPIRYSFVQEEATYFIARRRSWRAALLYKVMQILASAHFIQINSLLAQIINRKDIVWHSTDEKIREREARSRHSEIL